jgi:hypothetical protein
MKRATRGTVPALLAALVPALVAGLAAGASGCATQRAAGRTFSPAGPDETARALAAWRAAVERAETLPPSRLLYDAKIRRGIASLSGTLALSPREPVRGTLIGPFGSTLAVYENGALQGDSFPPVVIEAASLLSLLAGVWKAPGAQVRGIDGGDALLVWPAPSEAEGVLDVEGRHFRSLRIVRDDHSYEASYSWGSDPWPTRVDLEDLATSNRLQLNLQAREPL